jgi:hypothetical protein
MILTRAANSVIPLLYYNVQYLYQNMFVQKKYFVFLDQSDQTQE